MRGILVVAGLLLGTVSAQAQYVAAGKTVKLHFAASVNPDCSNAGTPTVRITRSPEHGRVTQQQTRDFTYFPPSNVRSACNTRRVSGVAIRYTAQRGYVGYDSVGVEIFYTTGRKRSGTFNINVR
jgi:hypothetical protein